MLWLCNAGAFRRYCIMSSESLRIINKYRAAKSFCIWRTQNADSMRRSLGNKDLDYFSTAPWNSD